MLSAPSQAFPAPGSQQRVSQSGRSKVALKPGRSLMDWIRLTKSGKDLTGIRGRLIEVTEEELSKHNTRNDCWTCIRGMVYNVTPYMEFHPGGEDELMKAAGVDGTDLFDQVHRWVNYESMLKECLVGRMKTKASAVLNGLSPSSPNMLLPLTLPTSQATPTALTPPPAKEHRPRFDWFQTDSTVSIVVYAKRKIPRTGATVVDLQNGTLRVEVLLGKLSYLLHLQLCHEVEDQVAVLIGSTVGKVQVRIRKASSTNWDELGQPLESHDSFLLRKDRAVFYRQCMLVSKSEVTHDTSLFRLRLPPGTHMLVPLGKHIYIKASVKGSEIVKPYTPVDSALMPETTEGGTDIFLMIKIYPDGVLTPHLNALNVGDTVSISNPDGPFSLRPLRDVTHLYLLAAGTGFTPMARLIRIALQDVASLRKIKLMFFNRREKDVLWRSELDQLEEVEERFEVSHVLSEPSEGWPGTRGQISAQMLADFLSHPEESKCYVCICGPSSFTELSQGLVRQMGFNDEDVHAFLG